MRFGEELRSERERRGISIEGLCSDTKVNRRFIEALERGDYRALPGGVFRRGFVRAYLKAVGLDEAEWLPRFDTSYGELMQSLGVDPENQDEAWATFAVNVKRNRGAPRRQFWKRWLGVLAMLCVLLAAGWAVWHYLLRARVRPAGGPRVSRVEDAGWRPVRSRTLVLGAGQLHLNSFETKRHDFSAVSLGAVS